MTTKRDTLVRAAFLDALALGQSISAAARLAGVHRSTVYHWNRTDPQVARALAASRAGCHSSLYDDIQDLASRALTTIGETIDNPQLSPSLRLRAALAVLKTASAPAPDSAPASGPAPKTPEFDTSVESVIASSSPDPVPTVRYSTPKPGRNEPCPCGSGRKYKHCCLNAAAVPAAQPPNALRGFSHINRDTQPESS